MVLGHPFWGHACFIHSSCNTVAIGFFKLGTVTRNFQLSNLDLKFADIFEDVKKFGKTSPTIVILQPGEVLWIAAGWTYVFCGPSREDEYCSTLIVPSVSKKLDGEVEDDIGPMIRAANLKHITTRTVEPFTLILPVYKDYVETF